MWGGGEWREARVGQNHAYTCTQSVNHAFMSRDAGPLLFSNYMYMMTYSGIHMKNTFIYNYAHAMYSAVQQK